MATRLIGGMSGKGLPEIEGAAPAAGGGCRGGGHGPRA